MNAITTDAPRDASTLANAETEAALLGAMMMEPQIIDIAADRLRIEDFSEPLHGRIYDAIVREHSLGGRPTPITLRPIFLNDPADLDVPSYLAQLTGSGAGLVGYRHFIDQIENLSQRRALALALDDARAGAADFAIPLAELVDRADAAIVASVERRESSKSTTLSGSIGMAAKRIAEIKANDGKVGFTTGIRQLDETLGGFEPGCLTIIGARPSMGKTAVACSAALGLARNGHGTLLVNLEMSAEQVGMRMASDLCCRAPQNWIPFERIVNGTTNAQEDDLLAKAGEHVKDWPLAIEDGAGMTLARLILKVRRHRRQMAAKGQQLRVVMIDYLQLLHSDDRRQSAYETVSEVSKGLKAMAKELGIAVVALAQLSRAVEQREDKRPMLSDLRDSGQIEQDADNVLFLYREEYYLERKKVSKAAQDDHERQLAETRGWLSLIVPKRRQGRVGESTCLFLSNYQAVRSAEWGR
ncbi:replicative DNA helicase [Stakelama pacifica]|nr:DnaB-like helicase C-terminal domain-containing protein [Stakelama pacifica]